MTLKTHKELLAEYMDVVRSRFGPQVDQYQIPPPSFIAMQGEFIDIDFEANTLTARFPVLEKFTNPYGALQGGMTAAAVDNAIGPLSVTIAPLNVTHTLEMEYKRPILPEMQYITVKAALTSLAMPKLHFEAVVTSQDGQPLATCRAVNWILLQPGT